MKVPLLEQLPLRNRLILLTAGAITVTVIMISSVVILLHRRDLDELLTLSDLLI